MSLGQLSAEERDVMLPYLRGLETYVACRPQRVLTADVIDFDDYLRTKRVQKAVVEQRRSAIDHTRRVLGQQHQRLVVDDNGWVMYDDE